MSDQKVASISPGRITQPEAEGRSGLDSNHGTGGRGPFLPLQAARPLGAAWPTSVWVASRFPADEGSGSSFRAADPGTAGSSALTDRPVRIIVLRAVVLRM
jgi:hypothetical protein